MASTKKHSRFALAALLVASVAVVPRALAGLCSDLPSPVYLYIDDAQEALVKRLAHVLRDNAPKPLTLVYRTTGPCTAIDSVASAVKLTGDLNYVPSADEDPEWTPDTPPLKCTSPAGGVVPDIAGASMFLDACGITLPDGVGAFAGPVTSYDFVVPGASPATAITAEEAYFVFGFGESSGTAPWTSNGQIFVRTATQVPTIVLGANIAVPPAQWQGTRLDTSNEVVSSLETSTQAAQSIGILATDVADAHPGTIRALPFQAFHQHGAYFPDSTADAHDRRNVRDGHYALWARATFVAPVNAGGSPIKPEADYLLRMLGGAPATPTPNFVPETLVAAVGLVPGCAMEVARFTNGGDLIRINHPTPCACLFDSTVGTPGPGCQTCNSTCPSGICRRGYCEAR